MGVSPGALPHKVKIKGNGVTGINAKGNQITNINVAKMSSLRTLDVSDNLLGGERAVFNRELEMLNVDNNEITALDLSGHNSLNTLYANNNQISEINVEGCTALSAVYVRGNMLESFSLSLLMRLGYMDCSDNLIGALDLSNATELGYLDCSNNNLSSLDLSNYSGYYLDCSHNNLESVDLGNDGGYHDVRGRFIQLFNLCNNKLTALDLSGLDRLRDVDISDNDLSADELNAMFESLHDKAPLIGSMKIIHINGNPGTDDCNVDIAERKGWSVIFGNGVSF